MIDLSSALARGECLVSQLEQVVDWAGPCAMLNGSADTGSLSCWANVRGEEIEVWTEAEAQRPKTLQQPVKETRNSATNGTSSLFIIFDFTSQGLTSNSYGAARSGPCNYERSGDYRQCNFARV